MPWLLEYYHFSTLQRLESTQSELNTHNKAQLLLGQRSHHLKGEVKVFLCPSPTPMRVGVAETYPSQCSKDGARMIIGPDCADIE